jgi:hypothetical protein
MRRYNAIPTRLLGLTALFLAASCASHVSDATSPIAFCTAPRSIAISVSVRDSVTGRSIADAATGIARLGTAVDTLQHQDSLTLLGGVSLGVYDLSVQASGYRSWTRTGVQVTQVGPCGNVEPVAVTALLQPAP